MEIVLASAMWQPSRSHLDEPTITWIESLARASTTRARCPERVLGVLAWTTCVIPWTSGRVPARQGINQKNVHEWVPVGDST